MLFNSGATLAMSANPNFSSNVTLHGTGSIAGVSTLEINGDTTRPLAERTSIKRQCRRTTLSGMGTFPTRRPA